MILRSATSADFGFIRGLAQRPENTPFITDEDEGVLAVYLANPAARMLIWGETAPRGFAIFHDITDPPATVNLMRLALDQPGQGEGTAFVRALIDYGFSVLKAQRLWLDASGENPRAQRLYEKLGFVLEGRLRQHWWRPAQARAVDVMLYGMMRKEWQP
jgi:GNAT superfamily N-acetyltransferase